MRDRLFIKDTSKLVIKLDKYYSKVPIPCPNCGELHMAFCEVTYKSNIKAINGKELACVKCSHESFLSELLKTTELTKNTIKEEDFVISNLKTFPERELKRIYKDCGVTNEEVIKMIKGYNK